MDDPDMVRPLRRPVIGPAQMAWQHVFWTLQPFEAYEGHDGQVRLTVVTDGRTEGKCLGPAGVLDRGRGAEPRKPNERV
jgi:hypothetical protein